ncbi:putative thiamine transporter SLC35F3 isoform X2 [Venturia canescens]|uniref:putative thiamine transporter SLC35F3 isoform X2 n=1 Tax=Venturia canescens TaxID=32260 RepID=UPI001C9D62D6|nr:putative thiamine transporter SLC35F3 isoform X2 [Venturia canescens]
MGSGGVGEVPTIFHPRRSRAPSIVLSEDQPSHGPYASPVQVVLDNSGCEQQGCSVAGGCGDSASSCRSLETSGSCAASGVGGGGSRGGSGGTGQGQGEQSCHIGAPPTTYQTRRHSISPCYSSCCAESAKKIYFGVCVTICVTASWVGATHCIKYLYFHKPDIIKYSSSSSSNSSVTGHFHQHVNLMPLPYNAPFFTTWFCTNWAVLYFPIYFLCRVARTKCTNPMEIIAESLRGFRDKGFTGGRFLTRCSLFCGLWVATNYMYIHSLRILLATDVMAVFATNVSCVYLLSWVILHEQFVGVRIVAVILCDTGIALLAYMDGITGSPTLGGVVLAAAAAAGSAVYKVLFKKVIGETTFGQVSLFFSLIGLCNAALLWPVCVALYFSGAESVPWSRLPWAALLSASILHLVANMLGNFSIALTYDLFITLGLITAVPVSAALDVVLYGAHFVGMKLAGIILIAVGFFLVMFPDNWPDYITRLLRTTSSQQQGVVRGGVIRSRRHSVQQRQFRRNYGVSSSHGDGQTLLPITSANNQTNSLHRLNANNPSSPEPSHRPPTSTSTTTNNNHHRTNVSSQAQQDGVEDTDTVCQAGHRAT